LVECQSQRQISEPYITLHYLRPQTKILHGCNVGFDHGKTLKIILVIWFVTP